MSYPRGPTALECLCYCNPFWCDSDSDDDYESDYDHDNEEIVFSRLVINESPPVDDGPFLIDIIDLPFSLPRNYNPVEEYYRAFDSIDTGDAGPLSSHYTKVNTKEFISIRGNLEAAQGREYPTLHSDLIYFRIYIASLLYCPEKLRLIKEYEEFRDKLHVFTSDNHMADAKLFLKNARDNKNGLEQRLIYYQKAIYYTHNIQKKNSLKLEYIQFCDNLKIK